jgi:hypothetical protein
MVRNTWHVAIERATLAEFDGAAEAVLRGAVVADNQLVHTEVAKRGGEGARVVAKLGGLHRELEHLNALGAVPLRDLDRAKRSEGERSSGCGPRARSKERIVGEGFGDLRIATAERDGAHAGEQPRDMFRRGLSSHQLGSGVHDQGPCSGRDPVVVEQGADRRFYVVPHHAVIQPLGERQAALLAIEQHQLSAGSRQRGDARCCGLSEQGPTVERQHDGDARHAVGGGAPRTRHALEKVRINDACIGGSEIQDLRSGTLHRLE